MVEVGGGGADVSVGAGVDVSVGGTGELVWVAVAGSGWKGVAELSGFTFGMTTWAT